MSGKRKKYDREFKLEAMKLVVDQDRSVAEVAASLGVGESVLHAWKRKYVADGKNAFPGQGRMTPDDDKVRELNRELTRVRQERDILKKAMAYFVNEKR